MQPRAASGLLTRPNRILGALVAEFHESPATQRTRPRSPCLGNIESSKHDNSRLPQGKRWTFVSLRSQPPSIRLISIWFALLGVGILGPLLSGGYLLLLDLPEGPRPVWPHVFPLPSEGLVSASAALGGTLIALLAKVSPEMQNKLLILAIVMVGGVGLARACIKYLGTSVSAAMVAATFFVVNPFVYDRVLMGQLVLLLAYALLPFTLRSLIDLVNEGSRSSLLSSLAWTSLIALVDLHIGGMSLLLLFLTILMSPSTPRAKLMRCLAVVGVLIALNLYWLIPASVANESARLGSGDLVAYAPRPRSPRILAHVLLLHGVWRTEFTSPLASNPVLFLGTFLPLLASACIGLYASLTMVRHSRLAKLLGLSALISIVLAMGTSFPATSWFTQLLFDHVPGYGIYREPQKWVALLAFCYAIFAAFGVDKLRGGVHARAPRVASLVAMGLLLPIAATSTMWWGFDGQLQTSEFPDDWARANEITRSQSGRLLFLPWNLYQPLPFAGNRSVVSPAERFFDMPVLVSGDAALGVSDSTAALDPRDQYMTQLLKRRGGIHAFGHLVAPLGVRFVALASIADAPEYGFLRRQADLRPVFEGDDLVLFENRAWETSVYGLESGPSGTGLSGNALSHQDEVTTTLVDAKASSPILDGPQTLDLEVFGRELQVPSSHLMGTDLSCNDGWKLQGDDPVCHLKSVAAFTNPPEVGILTRPGLSIQLLSMGASLLSAAALSGLLIRGRKSRSGSVTDDRRAQSPSTG